MSAPGTREGWKDAYADALICWCAKVTKGELIRAIMAGARSVEAVREATGACRGERCRVSNPSGRCCAEDVERMIEFYAPIVDALSEARPGSASKL